MRAHVSACFVYAPQGSASKINAVPQLAACFASIQCESTASTPPVCVKGFAKTTALTGSVWVNFGLHERCNELQGGSYSAWLA
jgi:hypothetical protein